MVLVSLCLKKRLCLSSHHVASEGRNLKIRGCVEVMELRED